MNTIFLTINLGGLIALLLWGVHMVQTGLQRAFGPNLKTMLRTALSNHFRAFAVGLGTTTLLQSSTAVGLMASSFVAFGTVGLAPALAVMLGANVGTTLIVQILSFDIAQAAALLVLAGVVLFRSTTSPPWHDLGRVAIGLGLMLMALHGLIAELDKIDNSHSFRAVVQIMGDQPLLILLLAAALTWLAHSSVAAMLLIMSLATRGILPFEAALAFVLGANLGTAINPWLEARHGDNPAARRLPLGNLLNRVIAIAIALPLLNWLAPFVLLIDDDKARAVANFHTAFNVLNALLFLPFLNPYASLLSRLIPDKPATRDPGKPRYLDPSARSTPIIALANAAREALRMADVLETMIRETHSVFKRDLRDKVPEIKKLDNVLDQLNAAIKSYLAAMDPQPFTSDDQRRITEILTFITNIEHAGDVIDRCVLHQATKRMKRGLRFSSEGAAEISQMIDRLGVNLRAASTVFITDDTEAARRLAEEKVRFRNMENSATEAHFSRLREGRLETKSTTSIHLDLIRDLKLVNSHLVAAAAYPVLTVEGLLQPSRIANS